MNETKIRKITFQHIEAELYDYQETRNEIARIRNDILYGSRSYDENAGGGRSNLPGNPTQLLATRLMTDRRLQHMETVVNAIDSVISALPNEQREVIRLRYWTRPQTLTWDGIAMKVGVSRRQAIRWRDKVIEMLALKIGWK